MKDVTIKNKLIADFMGLVKKDENFSSGKSIEYKKGAFVDFDGAAEGWLHYDNSWDWLMPVIEKIDGSCAHGITWAHIKTNGTEIVVHSLSENKDVFKTYPKKNTVEATKLSVTFYAVVEYIKWLNSKK